MLTYLKVSTGTLSETLTNSNSIFVNSVGHLFSMLTFTMSLMWTTNRAKMLVVIIKGFIQGPQTTQAGGV